MSTGHCNLFDSDLHIPGYSQDADPGPVGAGMLWVDTSGGPGNWEIKIRNEADTGWELIAPPPLVSNVRRVNVNYYLVADDDSYIVVVTAANTEIVLPDAAASNGRVVHIKKGAVNGFDVEVTTAGGLIEGDPSFFLVRQYEAITCTAVDGRWWVY